MSQEIAHLGIGGTQTPARARPSLKRAWTQSLVKALTQEIALTPLQEIAHPGTLTTAKARPSLERA